MLDNGDRPDSETELPNGCVGQVVMMVKQLVIFKNLVLEREFDCFRNHEVKLG